MSAFISALLFVVVAEMGDKTQLLAMALSSKYKIKHVFAGVFIATVLNHGIAVVFGNLISTAIPFEYIQIIAAISFIVFGLWTIRGDSIDNEKEKKTKLGPIAAVAVAFFIAEFGDKTQLMTIAIAAQYKQPVLVLMGTTVGMLIADGVGILGGAWLSKHIPEIYIKWGAAAIFIIFGIIGLYEALPANYLVPAYIIPFFIVLIALIWLIVYRGKKAGNKRPEEEIEE